jgi:two-component system sensor histidine kinase BaeS
VIAPSLTLRLAAAFLLTGLASVALVGVFARLLAGADFDRLVRERIGDTLVESAAEHYSRFGSWDGFRWDRSVVAPRGDQPPLFDPRRPLPFGVVDARGILVSPQAPHRIGMRMTARLTEDGQPIVVDGQRVGTLVFFTQSGLPSQRDREFLARFTSSILFASIAGALLATMFGIVLARRLAQPVVALTAAIGAMRRGETPPQVTTAATDEIGILVHAFNDLSTELDRAHRARQQMTADIAHELNTPLTIISGYLESMRDGVLSPTPARFGTMYHEARRLQGLIGDLRLLSLADAGDLRLTREAVDTTWLLQATVSAFAQQAEARDIELWSTCEAGITAIDGDPARLQQVLTNLVNNALQHTPAGGRIGVSAMMAGSEVRLQVQDTGDGIAPGALPHIFDRLYRADSARSTDGSGLGLAIARAIVDLHQGHISATSTVGAGTTIELRLPAVRRAL